MTTEMDRILGRGSDSGFGFGIGHFFSYSAFIRQYRKGSQEDNEEGGEEEEQEEEEDIPPMEGSKADGTWVRWTAGFPSEEQQRTALLLLLSSVQQPTNPHPPAFNSGFACLFLFWIFYVVIVILPTLIPPVREEGRKGQQQRGREDS
jgi:hypothetical protein